MRCGHEGCGCQAEQSGEFCSDYCGEHASDAAHGAHACECGHPDCQTSAADERTEQDIQAAFE